MLEFQNKCTHQNTNFPKIFTNIFTTISVLLLTAAAFAAPIPQEVYDLPAHFMIPTSKWMPLQNTPSNTVIIKNQQLPSVGLRIFSFPNLGRATTALQLASQGLIQDGDILTVFRPEWAHTVAYANMQLSISHSALAIVKNGRVHSVEVPTSYSSPMDEASHWMDLRGVHILRPHLTSAQRTNMKAWLLKLLDRGPGRISFKTNYLDPYFGQTHDYQFVNKLAGLAQGENLTLDMYCSEFVFSSLSLRNCDPNNFKYNKDQVADCISPIFEPLQGIGLNGKSGLLEGPSILLKSAGVADDTARRSYLINTVLVDEGDPAKMSQNHRELAKAFEPVKQALTIFYSNGEAAQIAAGINAQITPNYAPASLVTKAIEQNNIFDYVGSVYFHD